MANSRRFTYAPMSERMVFTERTAESITDRAASAPAEVDTEEPLIPKAPKVMALMVMLMRSTALLDPAPMCSTEAEPPETPKDPAAPSSKVIPLYDAELDIRDISFIS